MQWWVGSRIVVLEGRGRKGRRQEKNLTNDLLFSFQVAGLGRNAQTYARLVQNSVAMVLKQASSRCCQEQTKQCQVTVPNGYQSVSIMFPSYCSTNERKSFRAFGLLTLF